MDNVQKLDSQGRSKIADFVRCQSNQWTGYTPPSRLSAFLGGLHAAGKAIRRVGSAAVYAFVREWEKARMETICYSCMGRGMTDEGTICYSCMGRGKVYTRIVRAAIEDPLYKLADFLGEEGGEDEPEVELYKTVDGRYFVPSMLKATIVCPSCEGKGCANCHHIGKKPIIETGGQIVYAAEISVAGAVELAEEMEALALDVGLDEGEKILLKMLKRIINEREVA